MNHSSSDRQLPLVPFPGQPTPWLFDRAIEPLRARRWRFFAMPVGKGFVQVSLSESYVRKYGNLFRI